MRKARGTMKLSEIRNLHLMSKLIKQGGYENLRRLSEMTGRTSNPFIHNRPSVSDKDSTQTFKAARSKPEQPGVPVRFSCMTEEAKHERPFKMYQELALRPSQD